MHRRRTPSCGYAVPIDDPSWLTVDQETKSKNAPIVLCLALRAHIAFFDFFTTRKALEKAEKLPLAATRRSLLTAEKWKTWNLLTN
jgi:hypothetical protein